MMGVNVIKAAWHMTSSMLRPAHVLQTHTCLFPSDPAVCPRSQGHASRKAHLANRKQHVDRSPDVSVSQSTDPFLITVLLDPHHNVVRPTLPEGPWHTGVIQAACWVVSTWAWKRTPRFKARP